VSGPLTYPPVRYEGAGETSAWFRPAGAPAELVVPGGGAAAYLATGETTGGEFGLYRWDMGAEPSGPPAHVHKTISESFYVLSGTVRVYDGTAWTDAEPGDFLHVPVGGVHAFRNESGEPASMLLLFVPGAPREDYFETLADAARRDAMDEAAWAAFFARHDTHWL
jgi:mannose-6-phosphate isomerase-like protein (cupin superfamily)